MATQVTLKAERRGETGKGVARKLRASGRLPAVLYGAGEDAVSLTLDAHDAELLFRSISVDNTIIDLEVDGEKAAVPALIREIQSHPARPQLLHVDFLRIQAGVVVELEVPVHLEGTPVGVRESGGVLEHTVHDIPVRCFPRDIPEAFVVHVDALEVGDSIHISDLDIPAGVEVLIDPERTVCSVQVPTKLEVEEPEEDEEGEEPELVGEGEGEGEEVEEGDQEED